MRVGIDVRYLSHGLVGGVHTFLKNLVSALIEEVRGQHQLYLYADKKRPFDLPSLPDHITLRLLPYSNPVSSVRNDFWLAQTMARDRLDVAHFPANVGFGPSNARTVITLHDEINLMPLRQIWEGHPKNARTRMMMAYLHFLTTATVKRADLIVTISEYAKRQIVAVGKLDPDKIVSIGHGCPADIKRVNDPATIADVRQRFGITKPFILAEAFKNPAVIVRAWRTLPHAVRDGHQIVFFSRSPDVLPVVREAIEAGWAMFFVRPARADLAALYSMTEAFVFPSWIEGFGLPLVEAMTCGAPIIASNRAAIPEVVGDAALIMDAEDDKTLVDYLVRVLQHPEERERLSRLGYARAPMYTWRNAAKRYLEAYSETSRPAYQGAGRALHSSNS